MGEAHSWVVELLPAIHGDTYGESSTCRASRDQRTDSQQIIDVEKFRAERTPFLKHDHAAERPLRTAPERAGAILARAARAALLVAAEAGRGAGPIVCDRCREGASEARSSAGVAIAAPGACSPPERSLPVVAQPLRSSSLPTPLGAGRGERSRCPMGEPVSAAVVEAGATVLPGP